MKYSLQSILGVVGAYLGYFLGGFDGLLHALVIFVSIDYITGVMLSIVKKRLSSEVGAKGIFEKVILFLLVGMGHMVDLHIIKEGSAIRTAVLFFYMSNEGLSILENVSLMGLPIPEKLKQILKKLRGADHGK